jgi:N-methylhydantoinase B/oxoprolinase/acetone carboxylase alpha subunit
MQADPITVEVLGNRFAAIADEMEMVLLKSAYSALVKEALDASSAIFDARGRTLAQAQSIPAHLGMLVRSVGRVAQEYPEGSARPGDVYILNDPYDGGTHLPDVTVVVPAFAGEKLVGYAATMCHHQDIGGKAPGSTAPDAVDLTAEGLRIPLLKLFDAGIRNETLWALAKANVRVPAGFEGDLGAQLAAGNTGARRLAEVVEEWGEETVATTVDALLDYSERLTRLAIEAIPDGEYEFADFLDDDGVSLKPVRIQVKITVTGSGIHFDFTGTDPQVRGAINCVPASSMAAVYYAVRAITGPEVPTNDGCYRPISATLPEGSMVNPRYPAPVAARTLSFKRVADAIMGALAKALPARVPAASNGQVNLMYAGGFDPLKQRYYVGFLGVPMAGGMGARPTKDGIDLIETDLTNCIHFPTEACEAELPMRLNRVALWTDSGGAGKYRGGLGYEAELEWLRGDAILTIRRDRHKFHPWGLQGGGDAPLCRHVIVRKSGEEAELPSKTVTEIHEGDRLLVWTTGGGGFGNPRERDPEAVREDVLEGRVTKESALANYGVAIDDMGHVDKLRTLAARGGR